MSEGERHTEKGGERIAKIVARAGLASRREAETWIAAGRVTVNGEVIRSPARNVGENDLVTVDGEPLPARERTRLFLYHKPRGLLTTHADPQGRPTIFERLPAALPRLLSIGRLDFNTEGLLLLTNDGALARLLELPATGWLRRYRVRAHGTVTQSQLDGLRVGVTISGIHYGAIDASLERVQASNLWLTFAIREGKNREVRNVLNHLGLTVTRLIRVSFGPFQLGELAEGAVEEVRTRTLREQLGEKLVGLSGADFSSTPRQHVQGKKNRPKGATHSWRARADEQPRKPQGGKFHGSRRDDGERQAPQGKARAGVLTDRKGRPVPIERYGERPREEPAAPPPRREGHKRDWGRRRAPDRASGPRPRQPRSKR
jgi:23S rRNA pseudouridine2605 synthase